MPRGMRATMGGRQARPTPPERQAGDAPSSTDGGPARKAADPRERVTADIGGGTFYPRGMTTPRRRDVLTDTGPGDETCP